MNNTMNNVTVAVLERAREIVANGWTRGANYRLTGRVNEQFGDDCLTLSEAREVWNDPDQRRRLKCCVSGAMMLAEDTEGEGDDMSGAAIMAAMRKWTGTKFPMGVVSFNDHCDRTQKDILEILDMAITEAKELFLEDQ